MKLAASRSLLHGTVGRGSAASARRTGSHGVGVVVVRRRQVEPALLHDREVRRLALEHVEVAGEPRPGVQAPARVGGPGEHAGVREGLVLERRRRAGTRSPACRGPAGTRRPPGRRPPGRPPSRCRSRRPGRCRAGPRRSASSGPRCRAARRRRCDVTRTLWLVSPPGSSATRQDRPARMARRSRFSTTERIGASVSRRTPRRRPVSMVFFGPGEPLLGRDVPPDRQDDQRPEGEDRRVVDARPGELVVPRHAGGGEREHEVDRDDRDLRHRDEVHPLVLRPVGPLTLLERVAHPPAQPDRDQEGQVETDHRDRHHGVEAIGTPPMLLSAGRVMMTPITPTNITALAGIFRALTLDSQARPRDGPVPAEREGHPRGARQARGGAEQLTGGRDEQDQEVPSFWQRLTEDHVHGPEPVADTLWVLDGEEERQEEEVATDRRVEDRAPDALGRAHRSTLGLLGQVGRGVEARDRVLREQEAQRKHEEPVRRRC